MARIMMDEVANLLITKMPEISFIRIFVDDTIAAMHPSKIDQAMAILNSFRPNQIKFTKEEENDGLINFLNTTLKRHGNKIITKWYKKSFASGRLLNYMSSHKRTIILGTAIHFIKTVLILSDPMFFDEKL